MLSKDVNQARTFHGLRRDPAHRPGLPHPVCVEPLPEVTMFRSTVSEALKTPTSEPVPQTLICLRPFDRLRVNGIEIEKIGFSVRAEPSRSMNGGLQDRYSSLFDAMNAINSINVLNVIHSTDPMNSINAINASLYGGDAMMCRARDQHVKGGKGYA